MYSVLMACITTCYTALYAYFAYLSDEDKKEKIYKFWTWVTLPISVTAMSTSFVLKPRREDLPYKIFLYVQFFVFAYLAEFFGLVGREFETSAVVEASLECLIIFPALFMFGVKLR